MNPPHELRMRLARAKASIGEPDTTYPPDEDRVVILDTPQPALDLTPHIDSLAEVNIPEPAANGKPMSRRERKARATQERKWARKGPPAQRLTPGERHRIRKQMRRDRRARRAR